MNKIEIPVPDVDLELADTLDVIVAVGEIVADRELDHTEPTPESIELAHQMLQGPSFSHCAEEAELIFDQFTALIKTRWEQDGET